MFNKAELKVVKEHFRIFNSMKFVICIVFNYSLLKINLGFKSMCNYIKSNLSSRKG